MLKSLFVLISRITGRIRKILFAFDSRILENNYRLFNITLRLAGAEQKRKVSKRTQADVVRRVSTISANDEWIFKKSVKFLFASLMELLELKILLLLYFFDRNFVKQMNKNCNVSWTRWVWWNVWKNVILLFRNWNKNQS